MPPRNGRINRSRARLVRRFDAAIFDLDGVLADSASAHFKAWKRIAEELGIPFDEEANEALKGVDRMGSLRRILARGAVSLPQAELERIAARKNGYYLEAVGSMTAADLLPGASALIGNARNAGMKCALASASRNAPLLLEKLGIADLFDFVADAGAIAHPKPAPDIFLACCAALGVTPQRAVGFEDAAAGVAAIRAAGIYCVGIGDAAILAAADRVFASTADIAFDELLSG